MTWTAGIAPPSSFVMSPRCSIRGKRRLVMEMGALSISLAQRGTIPCRAAAREHADAVEEAAQGQRTAVRALHRPFHPSDLSQLGTRAVSASSPGVVDMRR